MYPDDLPPLYRRLWALVSICPFVRQFGFGFVVLVVVVGEGRRHHWRMAVAITRGYV